MVDFKDGGQYGELFGHDMVIADFNGDGLDDIVVAAPFWSKMSPQQNFANVGRVYYFAQVRSQGRTSGLLSSMFESTLAIDHPKERLFNIA